MGSPIHLRDFAPVAGTEAERRKLTRERARLDRERDAATDDYNRWQMLAPLPASEIGLEAVYAASSIRNSRQYIDGGLAVACDEHAAGPGAYCWHSKLSGVRGMCMPRYLRGIAAPRRASMRDPLLAEMAAATRYAQRDARIREATAR